ncbi:hypothetical protein H6P81_016147 [Aristolochia fimbriata]|uniref:Uncharacterized protein n=1 Tax=Aristolochia fimbriata TaxID=158543 RepID=A0AAV7EBA5_ARIFI|nr:hypothetical protein H6P81_016147 [Aristolochia fimbriata]
MATVVSRDQRFRTPPAAVFTADSRPSMSDNTKTSVQSKRNATPLDMSYAILISPKLGSITDNEETTTLYSLCSSGIVYGGAVKHRPKHLLIKQNRPSLFSSLASSSQLHLDAIALSPPWSKILSQNGNWIKIWSTRGMTLNLQFFWLMFTVNFQHSAKHPAPQLADKDDSLRTDNTRQFSEFKKVQKVPSGPSPIGNAHPPTARP